MAFLKVQRPPLYCCIFFTSASRSPRFYSLFFLSSLSSFFYFLLSLSLLSLLFLPLSLTVSLSFPSLSQLSSPPLLPTFPSFPRSLSLIPPPFSLHRSPTCRSSSRSPSSCPRLFPGRHRNAAPLRRPLFRRTLAPLLLSLPKTTTPMARPTTPRHLPLPGATVCVWACSPQRFSRPWT